MEATTGKQAAEKIKGLKLTATRLAAFERELGTPLTKLTTDNIGLNTFICLLKSAGLTDEEIDAASEELGLDKFTEECGRVLLNSGLFSQAKLPEKVTAGKKPVVKPKA